jgi:glycosyltransferase involved in cell wall biosynthesis
MRKLLLTGLYAPGSGLTNVLSVLVRELQDRFSIYGLGFQPHEVRSETDLLIAGRPLRVQASARPVFVADPDWLRNHMREVAPHGVLVTGSAFLVAPLLRQLQSYRSHCRIFLYLPVEGELVNEEIAETLALVDVCILYTEHARANAADLCARVARRDPGFRAPRFHVAGHGVDVSDFFPVAGGAAAARRTLFPDRPELERAFLVLNANRAYRRKRLDLTIEGFARFARDRPDARLYLHVCSLARVERDRLLALAAEAGVEDRVLLNALNPDGGSLSIERLNLLYNACDVGLTSAMGEGWGLGSFEHGATGAPQVVPDHTSFRENWQGAAELVPAVGREHIFYELADMFVVSPEGIAQALARLHDDPGYRQRMANAAYARSTDARYRWSAVGRSFASLLEAGL